MSWTQGQSKWAVNQVIAEDQLNISTRICVGMYGLAYTHLSAQVFRNLTLLQPSHLEHA